MRTKPLHFLLILIALLSGRVLYAIPTATIHITVSPGDTICYGTNTVFTATVTGSGTYGYIWMLNNTAVGTSIATYTSTTLANHDTVYCMLTNAAGDTVYANSDTIVMTVDSLPVIAPVTGLDSVCVGSHVQLSDATPGGVWSVTSSAAATINSTGLLTGIGPSNNNRAVYKMTNGCGSDSIRYRVRVNLGAGPVNGATSICMDSTTVYRDTTRGLWYTSDSTIAKFTSQFGLLQAYTTGTVTVYDNVVNACGSTTDSLILTIVNCDSASDTVNAVPLVNSLNKAVHIFPNPSQGNFTVSIDGNYTDANCVISNMIGEKVKEFTLSSGKQTDLTLNGHTGIYFITVTSGNEKYTSKIVVVQ